MRKVIQIILLLFISYNVKAQAVFVHNAKITFERKMNVYRLMGDHISEEEKKDFPKYNSTFWEYNFNETSSSYKIQKKSSHNDEMMMINESGEVYTEFNKNKRIFKKSVLDKDYIFTDTIPKIDWKIMHEVREIAGYECRKAIGVVNDSVYVVAFYTNEILPKGGPEGFTGLPGMILGLAVPRYSTTWFAIKVEELNIPIQTIVAPVKGKRIETDIELNKIIQLLKDESYSKKPPTTEYLKKKLFGFFL